MTTPSRVDDELEAGRALREQGIDRVEQSTKEVTAFLRCYAIGVAIWEGRSVSINDLVGILSRRFPDTSSRVLCGVFRGKQWQFAGYTQATAKHKHARRVALWRFVEQGGA